MLQISCRNLFFMQNCYTLHQQRREYQALQNFLSTNGISHHTYPNIMDTLSNDITTSQKLVFLFSFMPRYYLHIGLMPLPLLSTLLIACPPQLNFTSSFQKYFATYPTIPKFESSDVFATYGFVPTPPIKLLLAQHHLSSLGILSYKVLIFILILPSLRSMFLVMLNSQSVGKKCPKNSFLIYCSFN